MYVAVRWLSALLVWPVAAIPIAYLPDTKAYLWDYINVLFNRLPTSL
jgi:hypothetical protein